MTGITFETKHDAHIICIAVASITCFSVIKQVNYSSRNIESECSVSRITSKCNRIGKPRDTNTKKRKANKSTWVVMKRKKYNIERKVLEKDGLKKEEKKHNNED